MLCFTRIYCYIGVSNLILFLDCGKYFKSMSKFYFQQFFFKYILLFCLLLLPHPQPLTEMLSIYPLDFAFCSLSSPFTLLLMLVIFFSTACNILFTAPSVYFNSSKNSTTPSSLLISDSFLFFWFYLSQMPAINQTPLRPALQH